MAINPQKSQCISTNKDSTPCRAWAQQGSGYCFFHDPDKVRERRLAHHKGGSRYARTTLPKDSSEYRIDDANSIARLLSRTINQVLRGDIDPKVSNAVGYLSGVLLKAREQGALETRIKLIEEVLKKGKKQEQVRS